MVTTLWVLLIVFSKFLNIQSESMIIDASREVIDDLPPHVPSIRQRFLSEMNRRSLGDQYQGSLFSSRIALLEHQWGQRNQADRISFLTAARSGIDSTLAESSYIPARTLVWALPVLGFVGTALEIS